MRMVIITKGQALALLAMVIGLTMGITAWGILAGIPLSQQEAVAAFAVGSLFEEEITAETPLPTMEMVTAVAVPTMEPQLQDKSLHVEVIRDTPAPSTKKSILIYHTHTWEAYAQVEDAPYQETEKWRTKDNRANVVAVGEALTASLRALGFQVVHDTTAFEPPKLSDAYTRSLSMLEARQQQGESYDLYIDLHRDAYVKNSGVAQTVTIGGETVARLMMLIGKGAGTAFTVKPDWEANYVLAERLTSCLNDSQEGLCRGVTLKSGRFNQHIAPHCVLIECGNNMNTLEEVLRSVPYLAQAIEKVMTEE